MSLRILVPVAFAFWLAAPTAHAALQGRDIDGNAANGVEAYYDTVLDITWLADANHAFSSGVGVSTQGQLTWEATQSWIANTVNSGAGLYGVTDWRLPTTTLVNPQSGYTWSSGTDYFTGTADYAINQATPSNELGYMYYVNLGLRAWADTAGVERAAGTYALATPGITLSNPVRGGYYNSVMLTDLQTSGGVTLRHVSTDALWTGTTVTNDPNVGQGPWALLLYVYDGQMDVWETVNAGGMTNEAGGWLVTNGDKFAAPVPEPQTTAMFLLGLAAVAAQASRRARAALARRP